VLNALSLVASPESFLWWRWRDRLLSAGDPASLRTHLLVERWTGVIAALDAIPEAAQIKEKVTRGDWPG
jgi:hypothetical protein